eukprot:CAMPEP_0205826952 /NCGR_PEP_ID=MMETSP0206-20130828/30324_1 /ASSEMBLY_ACC=CAM_ASM_000279 /TAXON_ID=36767 /ORGANISM="Euplotes focardii, Strain TN1" /LENGTH=396 /DNA_ID=CAMNT_0053127333 /DNA_START=17 /DNA_END=1206 /DNA_ORIENTATION=-
MAMPQKDPRNSSGAALRARAPYAALSQTQGGPNDPYCNPGPVRDYDPSIYDRAISISDPRIVQEGNECPPNVRRRVIRRVEVPYSRRVKVPTTTQQVVPTMVEQRVRTKKLVSVPGFESVKESYTAFEEQQAFREREVWVKQLVKEPYMKRVPVQRFRTVQKPTTRIQEVEAEAIVQVPSSKVISVPGYRVDEVQDSKVVEVEEYQSYRMQPIPTGTREFVGTTELGRVANSTRARNRGGQVYDRCHPVVRGLPEDVGDQSKQQGRPATTGGSGGAYPYGGSYGGMYGGSYNQGYGAYPSFGSRGRFYDQQYNRGGLTRGGGGSELARQYLQSGVLMSSASRPSIIVEPPAGGAPFSMLLGVDQPPQFVSPALSRDSAAVPDRETFVKARKQLRLP